jgi:small subunit ribosomal protein S1
MADIDREVADAMAAMAPGDLAELSGGMTAGEDAVPGTELTGTIVGLSEDEAFLEFGAKAQGVLPLAQFGKKEKVNIGRRVDVVVERYDADGGLLIVNRKGEIQRATWVTLSVGAVVEGKVTGLIKGGLEVSLQGIRAFMPGSQVSVGPMKDISVLLNETVRCEVVELDRRSKNVIISRRKLIEREQADAREKLKAELAVGQLRTGVVRNITDFGAFVDLGGIEGLVHIRDLSWGTVDKVSDVLSPGQEVEVRVLKIEPKRDRISLGLKQAMPDPWVEVAQKYPVGTTLKARVIRTADFGAFAEVETGVEGLIPLSETSWTRTNKTTDAVSVGDMVDVVVIRLEPERHRLALSMKQAQPDPWDGVLDGFEERSLTKGRVTRLADFGVFVEVAPGVEGLIHISELADRRVKSCGEVVQVGEEIEARVLGVDRENRRISLSLKQVAAPQEPSTGGVTPPESPKPKKKRKKPLRGGLASHFDW